MNKHLVFSLLAVALLGMSSPGICAQKADSTQESDKTKAKEIRRDIGDVTEEIKDYTADKRDEAARNAKAALEDLDVRIKAMEVRIDKNWEKMDKTAREQARITLDALRKQRVQAAEWYGALKNSTAAAWGDMKKGFSDSYKSLRSAWEKAEREYGEERGK